MIGRLHYRLAVSGVFVLMAHAPVVHVLWEAPLLYRFGWVYLVSKSSIIQKQTAYSAIQCCDILRVESKLLNR